MLDTLHNAALLPAHESSSSSTMSSHSTLFWFRFSVFHVWKLSSFPAYLYPSSRSPLALSYRILLSFLPPNTHFSKFLTPGSFFCASRTQKSEMSANLQTLGYTRKTLLVLVEKKKTLKERSLLLGESVRPNNAAAVVSWTSREYCAQRYLWRCGDKTGVSCEDLLMVAHFYCPLEESRLFMVLAVIWAILRLFGFSLRLDETVTWEPKG